VNENIPFAAIDLDRFEYRILDPVFTYPMPAVKLALDLSIPFAVLLACGNDLYNQINS
jgi:hypothetical protein